MIKLKNAKMISEESEATMINNFGHLTTQIFKNEAKIM